MDAGPKMHFLQRDAAELCGISPQLLAQWKFRGYVRTSVTVPGLRRPCLSLVDLVALAVMIRLVEQDLTIERAGALARVLVDQEMARLIRLAAGPEDETSDSYLVYAVNPRLPVREQVFLDVAAGIDAVRRLAETWDYAKYPARMEVSLGAIIQDLVGKIKAMLASGRLNFDQESLVPVDELLAAPAAGSA
jgi:hypothetical protein